MLPGLPSSPNPSAGTSSGGSGFDPSGLITVAVGIAGNIIVSSNDASKRRALEQKIARLTLAQQKELAIRLQDVQSDIEKMKIVYAALAMDKNREALSALNKQKYIAYTFLGGALIILGIIIISARKQK